MDTAYFCGHGVVWACANDALDTEVPFWLGATCVSMPDVLEQDFSACENLSQSFPDAGLVVYDRYHVTP